MSLRQPDLQIILASEMASDGIVIKKKTMWLRHLTPGICAENIVVKVDRIINVEHVRDAVDFEMPSKVLYRYEMVLFDETLTHMVLEMDSEYIWEMFAGRFGEDRVYQISHFSMLWPGQGRNNKFEVRPQTTTSLCSRADGCRYAISLVRYVFCVRLYWFKPEAMGVTGCIWIS